MARNLSITFLLSRTTATTPIKDAHGQRTAKRRNCGNDPRSRSRTHMGERGSDFSRSFSGPGVANFAAGHFSAPKDRIHRASSKAACVVPKSASCSASVRNRTGDPMRSRDYASPDPLPGPAQASLASWAGSAPCRTGLAPAGRHTEFHEPIASHSFGPALPRRTARATRWSAVVSTHRTETDPQDRRISRYLAVRNGFSGCPPSFLVS